MRIRATETVNRDIEVNIPITHVWDNLRSKILLKHNIGVGWELRDDGWFYQDDEYRHGTPTSSKVKEATDVQIEVYKTVNAIQLVAKLDDRAYWEE